jgi:hypothetical protein
VHVVADDVEDVVLAVCVVLRFLLAPHEYTEAPLDAQQVAYECLPQHAAITTSFVVVAQLVLSVIDTSCSI